MIASIEKVVLRRGRDGRGPTWFHPRACLIPGANGPTAFMPLQTIMGNFHPLHVSPEESWVTVGEWQPKNGIHGDLLLARIRWSQPNRLALAALDLKAAEGKHP